MSRPRLIALAALVLAAAAGCAGPTRLAERSQQKLAGGDMWRAWQLATRALEHEPLNPHARAAATAAGNAIASDWERRITALAVVDSLKAADQVLEFDDFLTGAARYTTQSVSPGWTTRDRALRTSAARQSYLNGTHALASHRPKLAFNSFRTCERYVPGFRDAGSRSDAAYEQSVTRVAVMPFGTADGDTQFGREVADRWRDALAQELLSPHTRFTRVLGPDAISSRMTVSQLGHLSREDAVRLGRKCGAQRVVCGFVGPIRSETHLQFYRDTIARRETRRNPGGELVSRWVEIPIEVVARVRDVTVNVDHDVISTVDGNSLSHQRTEHATSARVVWTSFVPEGELNRYALVADDVRTADPARAKDRETRWKAVCGEATTLQQVLAARRETRGEARYDRGALPRFMAGAAFVFLQELPPAEDLALAALAHGWQPLQHELARLDGVDDVDLGVAVQGDD